VIPKKAWEKEKLVESKVGPRNCYNDAIMSIVFLQPGLLGARSFFHGLAVLVEISSSQLWNFIVTCLTFFITGTQIDKRWPAELSTCMHFKVFSRLKPLHPS